MRGWGGHLRSQSEKPCTARMLADKARQDSAGVSAILSESRCRDLVAVCALRTWRRSAFSAQGSLACVVTKGRSLSHRYRGQGSPLRIDAALCPGNDGEESPGRSKTPCWRSLHKLKGHPVRGSSPKMIGFNTASLGTPSARKPPNDGSPVPCHPRRIPPWAPLEELFTLPVCKTGFPPSLQGSPSLSNRFQARPQTGLFPARGLAKIRRGCKNPPTLSLWQSSKGLRDNDRLEP